MLSVRLLPQPAALLGAVSRDLRRHGLKQKSNKSCRLNIPSKALWPQVYRMPDHFISEPIKPVISTVDTSRMAIGEPGLPQEFIWRGKKFGVAKILKTWRTTKPCHHGSGEKYVRKHWYQVLTADGRVLKIYFDRQPETGRKGMGWFLFSMKE
jgi:hypothetical protein